MSSTLSAPVSPAALERLAMGMVCRAADAAHDLLAAHPAPPPVYRLLTPEHRLRIEIEFALERALNLEQRLREGRGPAAADVQAIVHDLDYAVALGRAFYAESEYAVGL